MRTSIPHRPIHYVLFYLLAYLCYQAHQLTRHVVGAALCGGLGTTTFTMTVTRQPCILPAVETLSGPVLTLILAYVGMVLLRSNKLSLFAYALIFASFQHLRWIQTVTGRGDELVLAQQWSAAPNRLLVAAIVFLIGIPPIWAAFHAIGNPRRRTVFIVSYLLPLPLLFALLFLNRFLFGENGDITGYAAVLGIPLIVLIPDLIAIALLAVLTPQYILNQTGDKQR